jgi:hypothetical protein
VTVMVLPPSTHKPLHGAVMVFIDSAEDHALLSGGDAAYLRAGVYAALEDGAYPSQRCERTRIYRRHALRVLAECRRGWEPDDDGVPVLDSEIGQVARYLAADSAGSARFVGAWRLLCESVDVIAGLDSGTVDPAGRFDPGAPGSVEAKRTILRDDTECDVVRALTGLLRTPKAA